MHSQSIENMVVDEIKAEAERSVTLGDALDLKGNIWLVVITFLAAQTAYFFDKALTPLAHQAQVLSAILLVLAGVLTLIELCPRSYMLFSPSNGALEERIAELRGHYLGEANADTFVSEQISKDQVEWAKQRIIKNHGINKLKAGLIVWAFWLTALAASINFLTLLQFVKHPS